MWVKSSKSGWFSGVGRIVVPLVAGLELQSLGTRNLLRGNAFLLPGGEKVAEAIGCDPKWTAKVKKRIANLSDAVDGALSEHGVPLWLWILAEAEVIGREESDGSTKEGEALGPVGATI